MWWEIDSNTFVKLLDHENEELVGQKNPPEKCKDICTFFIVVKKTENFIKKEELSKLWYIQNS